MTQTLVEKMNHLLSQENPDAPLFIYHETIKQWRDEVANMNPNGGSSPWEIIRVPITFDTPELVLGAGGTGVVLYTPSVGDLLFLASGSLGGVFIPTPWNGATPAGYLMTLGTDWTGNTPGVSPILANIDMTVADNDDQGNGDVFLMSTGAQFLIGPTFRFATTTPLVFGIDDESGGDPGSDRGEGEVVIAICKAT